MEKGASVKGRPQLIFRILYLNRCALPLAPLNLNFLIFNKISHLSHSKERSEKICLNCSAALHGRYCHECGQENIEPRQSVWHLVTHFFYDITHFDGKFFTTLKDLLFKPGFLSREYISGKRISYLHPIRMYVFTSAFFFIIFFSVFNLKEWRNAKTHLKVNGKSVEQGMKSALANAKTKEDSAAIEMAFKQIKDIPLKVDSVTDKDAISIVSGDHQYSSVEQYDSIQHALPSAARDGWIKRMMTRKEIDLNIRYKDNRNEMIRDWVNAFLHNFPKLLFVSLPLFALLLELLYIRRRKQFYYSDHAIFAIHMYIFSFIALLFIFGINYLSNVTGWPWLWLFNTAIILYVFYYYYKAMRNFYRQSGWKTAIKYLLLYLMSFFVIIFLFSFFFLFSIMEV